jgi:hypothetical protein
MSNAYLEPDGRFVMEDFNRARFFASFLPGIAGKKGVPSWAYFVNRGQCLAGFGFSNKDGALQEFVPADKAAWYAACRGFRTFIKIQRADSEIFYEPFQLGNYLSWHITNQLTIDSAEITITELNRDLGIEVQVVYYGLPGEKFGGLCRKTTIVNHNSMKVRLQVIDGLAVIFPAGYNDFWAKKMGATIRAWMTVKQVAGVPVYKLKYLADDVPELLPVQYSHFFLGYTPCDDGISQPQPIYDPAVIFGLGAGYEPLQIKEKNFKYPERQSDGNNLGAAFSYLESEIAAKDSINIYGLYGRVSDEQLLPEIKEQVGPGYFERHREQNRRLIQEIKDHAWVHSGIAHFDPYIGQSFLDNVLRGGLPVTLNPGSGPAKIFWLYSRKHGDLERDYNDFQLSPTYYSQGNGNFRDLNQNRRNDLWFNTGVQDSVLHYFWNLIQLDGYNPLVVKGLAYRFEDRISLQNILHTYARDHRQVSADVQTKILHYLEEPFTPGELLGFLESGIGLAPEQSDILGAVLIENAAAIEQAEYREGYWIDHWTYNLDLFDSYLAIYPDGIGRIAFERSDYSYFDSPARLTPLNERFYLEQGRVYNRHCVQIDSEKQQMISKRKLQPDRVRTEHGNGDIYHTNLFVKMLSLALNKLASFDPMMAGLEMDTGRPGWCDAVNGLPGILGSSTPEVFALKRLLQQMQRILTLCPDMGTILLPAEIGHFFREMYTCLERAGDTKQDSLDFWQKTHQCRERYLQTVRFGLNGQQTRIATAEILNFLGKANSLVTEAIGRAFQPEKGLYHTYFYYQVTRWQVLKTGEDWERQGDPAAIRVWPEDFEQYSLPQFLEGQVAALRNAVCVEKARDLYQAVRRSDLFDAKLQMYKVCADLSAAPDELGRIRVFRRGWLENESVFLHMEYKYLLEILRNGLEDEFFNELPKLLVCFLDPAVYGRNPLENSSFIVSSAYPEPDWHSNGFVARLSGSTAEMINIWLWMSFGIAPFHVNSGGELELEFRPTLSKDFFSALSRQVTVLWEDRPAKEYQLPAHSYAAKFLAKTLVIYNNPALKQTYGPEGTAINRIFLEMWDGKRIAVNGPKIIGELAHKVRQGLVEKIELVME